jgi:hypothetical protein
LAQLPDPETLRGVELSRKIRETLDGKILDGKTMDEAIMNGTTMDITPPT